MEENRQIVSVQPGFMFECQRCGRCCYKNVPLGNEEQTFLSEHGIQIYYTVSFSKVNGNVKAVLPSKPPGPCPAYFVDPTGKQIPRCLIYDRRPDSCRLYPLVLRIYHHKPPTDDEILDSMRLPRDHRSKQPLKHYLRRLDDHRWAFLGCTLDPGCPGIGKGKPWTVYDIKRFIAENIYTYEHSDAQSQETSRTLMENFGLTDRARVESMFIKDMDLFEDDKVKIELWRARNELPEFNIPSRCNVDLNKPSVLKKALD